MIAKAIDKIYSPKQVEVLKYYFKHREDLAIILNHGAVRSGKTMVDNDIFLNELIRIRDHCKAHGISKPLYIVSGTSLGTIKRNILIPLEQKYGFEFRLDKFNMFELFGVIIYCVGHDDIGALKAVTGLTAYGAYVNEACLANKDVFDEILKRLSADRDFNALLIGDTNPDGPLHWLKVDYIDRANLPDKRTKCFHWTINDNPFLGEKYLKNLIATTPSGVFYHRKIDGLWLAAEGLVYEDFDNDNIIGVLPNGIKSYFVGVDWGFSEGHSGVMTLWGEIPASRDDEFDIPTYVLIKEINSTHRHISWWCEQAVNLASEYGWGIPFFCDTARPDNISEFKSRGLYCPYTDKAVAAGIECVAMRKKRKKILVYRPGIREYLQEQAAYVWNPKTGLPVKENDNTMDSERYAVFNRDIQNGLARRTY